MKDVTELLKMIETVDPANTAKLDEIDARTQCYLDGHEFVQMCSLIGGQEFSTGDNTEAGYQYPGARVFMRGTNRDGRKWNNSIGFRSYTRSRDALKAIRPDFWSVSVFANMGIQYVFEMGEVVSIAEISKSDSIEFKSPELPTEELAELHAIIQAIAHDRAEDKGE